MSEACLRSTSHLRDGHVPRVSAGALEGLGVPVSAPCYFLPRPYPGTMPTCLPCICRISLAYSRKGSDKVFGGSSAGRVDPGFHGNFMDLMLLETERVHSLMRRYTSPSEHAFFPSLLPRPILPPIDHNQPINPNSININDKIRNVYIRHLVPGLCQQGEEQAEDDNQYGSTATCDIAALQALSARIHYGKFVAEAKFLANREA